MCRERRQQLKLKINLYKSEVNQHGTQAKGEPWNQQTVHGWKVTCLDLLQPIREREKSNPEGGKTLKKWYKRFILYFPSGAWWNLDVATSFECAGKGKCMTDTERWDFLEKWITENQYRYDVALQSDEEDGVWFSRFRRYDCGEIRGTSMEYSSPPPRTVRAAVDAWAADMLSVCPDCGVIFPCREFEHREGCSAVAVAPKAGKGDA